MNNGLRKLFSIILVAALSGALILELGVSSYADEGGHPYPQINPCPIEEEHNLIVPMTTETDIMGNIEVWQYTYLGETVPIHGRENKNRFDGGVMVGRVYHENPVTGKFELCPENLEFGAPKEVSAGCAHEHNFAWQTISEPTMYSDGLAGDVCTVCGYAKNTQPLSAYGFAINDYGTKLVEASKSGQIIKIELGEWNSFPKSFMEKIAAKSAQNVTFVLKYKWNHVNQEITIPAFSNVDTSLDWYGPAKMAELYGVN